MFRQCAFTRENFDSLCRGFVCFEEDFWSIQHSLYLLDFLFGEYEKIPLSGENEEIISHLQYGINFLLSHLSNLRDSFQSSYFSAFDCAVGKGFPDE